MLNSHLIRFAFNNGDLSHCDIAASGNPSGLASVPGLLNYNFGRLAEFEEVIANREFGSSCSRKLFHGKFDEVCFH